ncbi:hypothetical protein IFO69_19805 [Echinicola sp. CAU 1574]|uniref:Glycoside hydrolase family 5 domain-containing protein n=1 Tax=Echinicola arenosa TaxID=2774144 RepID=A0ABR9AQE3_9BACT|nr:hypothetical protein [Echinicola arenosa]MBD8491008.1 hypothetical protein [Echinicola arenosa]
MNQKIVWLAVCIGLLMVTMGFLLLDHHPKPKTMIAIKGAQFYINNEVTYKERYWNSQKIEGLLFNARMVQGIFDDLNPKTRGNFIYPDTKKWSPERNTREFVKAMASWKSHGLLAFTLNLQGGSPTGYGNKDWINSTFDSLGNLRSAYINRLEKILERADELNMVVILGYFYFGQDQVLKDEPAVINAVDNITRWIIRKGYGNVLIEINNECDIHYDHDILKPDRVTELIKRVKKISRNQLLVSTSYSGKKVPSDTIIRHSDFVLLHGNGASPEDITDLVDRVRASAAYSPKPILFNEDDHYDYDLETNNLFSSIASYASWGYFDFRRDGEGYESGFQSVPVDWEINSKRKIQFFEKLKEITGN